MPVRLALAGYGPPARELARTIAEAPTTELVAIYDPDARQRAAAQRAHPGVAVVPALDDCVEDAFVEGVVVATALASHYPVALAALCAGKHVLVDAPFVTEVRDGFELDRVAQQSGLVLAVGHASLHDAGISHVREHVETHQLGDLLYLRTEHLSWREGRADLSALWGLAAHDVAALLHVLAADPSVVTAHGAIANEGGAEDVVFLALEFGDGTVAHVNTSWLDPATVRQLTVVGNECSLRYRLTEDGPRVWVHSSRGDDSGTRSNGRPRRAACTPWEPSAEPVQPLHAQWNDLARAIRRGTTPGADARIGLRVTNVLQAAGTSLAHGGRPIRVPDLTEPAPGMIRLATPDGLSWSKPVNDASADYEQVITP